MFCSKLYAVCLEMQVFRQHSNITFEHVPPSAACHRVEGQGMEWSEPVQELCH